MKPVETATLLVVDDEPDITEIIQGWLECEEIRVLKASRANDALNLLRDAPIDILLSDIRMPDMDGIALYRRAEAIGAQNLEVLLMTASYDPRRGDVIGKGVRGVIQKPFSSRELLSWIYYSVSPRLKAPFEKKLRYPVQLRARYGKNKMDLAYEGTILNVSMNGALLGTDGWMPKVGEVAYVRVRIPEKEPLFLVGKAVWAKHLPAANSKVQVGLDLTQSPETGLNTYRAFVKELLGKSP